MYNVNLTQWTSQFTSDLRSPPLPSYPAQNGPEVRRHHMGINHNPRCYYFVYCEASSLLTSGLLSTWQWYYSLFPSKEEEAEFPQHLHIHESWSSLVWLHTIIPQTSLRGLAKDTGAGSGQEIKFCGTDRTQMRIEHSGSKAGAFTFSQVYISPAELKVKLIKYLEACCLWWDGAPLLSTQNSRLRHPGSLALTDKF